MQPTMFLAMGAGAIAQVVHEVGRLSVWKSVQDAQSVLSPAILGGFVADLLIIYATALLVTA